MKYISSRTNENIQRVKYLFTKKGRDDLSLFIVEGEKMVREALTSCEVTQILMSDTYYEQNGESNDIDLLVLKDDVFISVSDTKTPQGIMAIVKIDNDEKIGSNIELFAQDVQDPGNIGTIIRTCESFGVSNISITEKCADPYNPKVVRSSMGSILRIGINKVNDTISYIQDKKDKGYIICAGHLGGNDIYNAFESKIDKVLLIIGNESKGISDDVALLCDKLLKIPIYGKNESLNVSVATGILLSEIKRKMI